MEYLLVANLLLASLFIVGSLLYLLLLVFGEPLRDGCTFRRGQFSEQ